MSGQIHIDSKPVDQVAKTTAKTTIFKMKDGSYKTINNIDYHATLSKKGPHFLATKEEKCIMLER